MPIHSQILKFKENQTTLYYYDVHRNTIPNFKMLLFFSDEYFLSQMCLFTLDTTRLVKKVLFLSVTIIFYFTTQFFPLPL